MSNYYSEHSNPDALPKLIDPCTSLHLLACVMCVHVSTRFSSQSVSITFVGLSVYTVAVTLVSLIYHRCNSQLSSHLIRGPGDMSHNKILRSTANSFLAVCTQTAFRTNK